MAGLKWSTPPTAAWPAGADAYVRAVRAGVHGVCQKWVPQIEAWMKTNRPWTDRTSAAVQSLWSNVEPPSAAQVADVIEVIMAHGVEYGTYLEGYLPDGTPMKRGQQWAVIQPALDYFAPKVWADIKRLFT